MSDRQCSLQLQQEARRIRAVYEQRRAAIPVDYYALYRPANLFLCHSQEQALLDALRRAHLVPLANRKILEVGCGSGQWLVIFERFGAPRETMAGIDLDAERARLCARRFPESDVRVGDASRLPWPDRHFDVVFQSTVFTSILDPCMKQAVASEMLRVLRPDGYVIWYDFFVNNPRNSHVRGIGWKEIRKLFPGCRIRGRRVTLAPPLARAMAPRSSILASTLERLRLLNTHYMLLVQQPHSHSPLATHHSPPAIRS